MKETKTILLIGRSGRGKSTLANVLSGTNNFKESLVGTRKIQCEKFSDKENNIDYLVIDTPGVADTKLPTEMLDIIAEAVYLSKGGISQVFFVTDGRFDQYEMTAYDLLRTVIFDESIVEHTTIVRTHFNDFENGEKCKNNIDLMLREAAERRNWLKESVANDQSLKRQLTTTNLAEIIESCQGRVVHVNNPPMETKGAIEKKLKKREKSREILLEHLKKVCQAIPYKPPKLEKLSKEIVDYMENKIKLKVELKRRSENKENKLTDGQEFIFETSVSNNTEIEKGIIQLEEKKEKLKKAIQIKEKSIRQKALRQIFNNYDGIANEIGDNIFVDSIVGDNNNWEDINKNFIKKKLVRKWLTHGFNHQETQEWANALGSNFNPTYASFCAWLRDNKKLTVEKVLNIKELSSEYTFQLKEESDILDQYNSQLGQEGNYEEIKSKKVRNILLIGRTGSGKSSLANVLLNKNNNFEEEFEESDGSTTKTRKFQDKEFEEDGIKYRIIDTIGFDDTSLSKGYILDKTEELLSSLKEGVNQIFFVTNGMFTKEEVYAYNFLKERVFGKNIGQYTTIVRTKFPNFQKTEELYKDLKRMIQEGDRIFSFRDIIHVDNPSINADTTDDDKSSREKREKSREILLDCLNNCDEIYELQDLKKLNPLSDGKKIEVKRKLAKKEEVTEKKGEITLLEQRVQELTNLVEYLVKKQKEKILNAYLFFSPEKEKLLLQELINEHLEFTKFKEKTGINSPEYSERCKKYEEKSWEIKKELRIKLSKEVMNEIRHVLADCEELANWELFTKLNFQSTHTIAGNHAAGNITYPRVENNSWLQEQKKKTPQASSSNSEGNSLISYLQPKKNEIDRSAQGWFNWNYSQKERGAIKKLDISSINLKGKLKLEGFINLEELNCSQNQLSELDISDCPKLKILDCSFNNLKDLNLTDLNKGGIMQLEELACNNNYLTNLDFSILSPEKLTSLNISDNNFPKQDLSIFSRFVNLKSLLIGNEGKRYIERDADSYNRFSGSLEPLKGLNKLELLYISNTDIDTGLEYLPSSVQAIYCSAKEIIGSKVEEIAKELNDFAFDEEKGGHDFQDWRNKQLEAKTEIPTKK